MGLEEKYKYEIKMVEKRLQLNGRLKSDLRQLVLGVLDLFLGVSDH